MIISRASTPSLRHLVKDPVLLLAFGLGSGLASKAPGTFGTLLAVPLFLMIPVMGLIEYSILILMMSLVGIWICGYAANWTGVKDHSGIVFDEVAGYFVTMFAVPGEWVWMIAGFVLFRLFDIWKPGPIGWLDKHTSGGFGIMIDDLLAGVFACLCLHGIIYFT